MSQLAGFHTEQALHELVRPELDGTAEHGAYHTRQSPSPELLEALLASDAREDTRNTACYDDENPKGPQREKEYVSGA